MAGVGKRPNAVAAPAALPAKIVRRVSLQDVMFDDMACPPSARSRHGHSAHRVAAKVVKPCEIALECSGFVLFLGRGRNCNVDQARVVPCYRRVAAATISLTNVNW